MLSITLSTSTTQNQFLRSISSPHFSLSLAVIFYPGFLWKYETKWSDKLWNRNIFHNLSPIACLKIGGVLFLKRAYSFIFTKITLTRSCFCVFSDEAYNSTIDTMDNSIKVRLFYKLRNLYTILMKLCRSEQNKISRGLKIFCFTKNEV